MLYKIIKKQGYILYINKNGKKISSANGKIIEQDGAVFRDLEGDGILYPYEDWRNSYEDRAKNLVDRMSVDEMIGLTLHTTSQPVPAMPGQMENVGTYGGLNYLETKEIKPSSLTDQQKSFIEQDGIRHILVSNYENIDTMVEWVNNLQAKAESNHHGIPVNLSSDPRHGADGDRVEFRNVSRDVSRWPEGLGMASVFDNDIAYDYAKTVAKEYRALGITTALGPQIDFGSDPRWFRIQDTYGMDVDWVTQLAQTICDGLQTTDGESDGWGEESVIAMCKHWPGGGTGEGGRDAHYPFGKYAVYPGDNFKTHLRPFTEGAFKLKNGTKTAAAVMPYYNVPWNQDKKYGENVGNAYNKYIIKDLLIEKYGYEGVICTDWGITKDMTPHVGMYVMGGKSHGVEGITQPQRILKLMDNGVNQFGGLDDRKVVDEAYKLGVGKYGSDYMNNLLYISAYKLILNMMRLGLFDNPFIDIAKAKKIFGSNKNRKKGIEAQRKSPVLLKNKNDVLPIKTFYEKVKVYIPVRHVDSYYGFVRMKSKAMDMNPVDDKVVNRYFRRIENPDDADVAIVFIDSPRGRNGYEYDMMKEEEQKDAGYYPISLQYRPYTAKYAREVSIAGGDPREMNSNRSYKDRTEVTANEMDLDLILNTRKVMGDKPVIVVLRVERPTVVAEFEKYADAIIVDFGIDKEVLFELITGKYPICGKLPIIMPESMETVEIHCEDRVDDMKAYIDECKHEYKLHFGL
ncbi:MAG: glycoside hydrolase family 3 protein [Lachnospiraceae bacterium]|nr:glycoside hydrolase family 3 protein [Lachnospiraceae bacterium]